MDDPVDDPDLSGTFSPTEILTTRSRFETYGTPEIFVDRVDLEIVEISPETAACKLVVDLVMLTNRLNGSAREQFVENRNRIIEPIRKLIIPLISGESPYLEGTTTPEQMLDSMLDWLREGRESADNLPLQPDYDVLAVFLTLDVLLDGADLRQALGRSIKLNMPQMFHCLCHLILKPAIWPRITPVIGKDSNSARRKLLSDFLRLLQRDQIARQEPDASLPAGIVKDSFLH
jgi:hypothetical protein